MKTNYGMEWGVVLFRVLSTYIISTNLKISYRSVPGMVPADRMRES